MIRSGKRVRYVNLISPVVFLIGISFSISVYALVYKGSQFPSIAELISLPQGSELNPRQLQLVADLILILLPATVLALSTALAAIVEAPARLPNNHFRYVWWVALNICMVMAIYAFILNTLHLKSTTLLIDCFTEQTQFSSCQEEPLLAGPAKTGLLYLLIITVCILALRYVAMIQTIQVHIAEKIGDRGWGSHD